MLSALFNVSSAALRSGSPGTAIFTKFIVTLRVRLAVLFAASVAVTEKTIGEVEPIVVQSEAVKEYVQDPFDGERVFVSPANSRVIDAPTSTAPEIATPESFSERTTTSFPATVDSETVGGVVSILHVFAVDDADVLPAGSTATALMKWSPSLRVAASKVHVPFVATIEASCVAGFVELSLTVTVEPTSAVPDRVGVASLVNIGDVPLTTGTVGASVS